MTYTYIRRGRFLYLPELHQASQWYTQHRGCDEERRWESEEKKNKIVGPLNAPIGLQAAAATLHDSQIPRKIADKIASAWDADGPAASGRGTRHGQRPAGKGRRRTADRCRVRARPRRAAALPRMSGRESRRRAWMPCVRCGFRWIIGWISRRLWRTIDVGRCVARRKYIFSTPFVRMLG